MPTWSHVAGEFAGACASTGSVEVVFTATDACGNSTSYTGTFTIQDTTAPSFDGDLQLEFGCNDFDMAESYVSVEDACGDVALTWEDIELSGGCVKPVGRYLRLYTATDECGNVAQFEQSVLLVDSVAPTLTVPEGFTVDCDVAIVYDDAVAVDDCGHPFHFSGRRHHPRENACPNTFTIVRTFTAETIVAT